MAEPPPPGAEEEPPAPGVDTPASPGAAAGAAVESAYAQHGYAAQYPPTGYADGAGYAEYYSYYYSGYPGYGQYGYEGYYAGAAAAEAAMAPATATNGSASEAAADMAGTAAPAAAEAGPAGTAEASAIAAASPTAPTAAGDQAAAAAGAEAAQGQEPRAAGGQDAAEMWAELQHKMQAILGRKMDEEQRGKAEQQQQQQQGKPKRPAPTVATLRGARLALGSAGAAGQPASKPGDGAAAVAAPVSAAAAAPRPGKSAGGSGRARGLAIAAAAPLSRPAAINRQAAARSPSPAHSPARPASASPDRGATRAALRAPAHLAGRSFRRRQSRSPSLSPRAAAAAAGRPSSRSPARDSPMRGRALSRSPARQAYSRSYSRSPPRRGSERGHAGYDRRGRAGYGSRSPPPRRYSRSISRSPGGRPYRLGPQPRQQRSPSPQPLARRFRGRGRNLYDGPPRSSSPSPRHYSRSPPPRRYSRSPPLRRYSHSPPLRRYSRSPPPRRYSRSPPPRRFSPHGYVRSSRGGGPRYHDDRAPSGPAVAVDDRYEMASEPEQPPLLPSRDDERRRSAAVALAVDQAALVAGKPAAAAAAAGASAPHPTSFEDEFADIDRVDIDAELLGTAAAKQAQQAKQQTTASGAELPAAALQPGDQQLKDQQLEERQQPAARGRQAPEPPPASARPSAASPSRSGRSASPYSRLSGGVEEDEGRSGRRKHKHKKHSSKAKRAKRAKRARRREGSQGGSEEQGGAGAGSEDEYLEQLAPGIPRRPAGERRYRQRRSSASPALSPPRGGGAPLDGGKVRRGRGFQEPPGGRRLLSRSPHSRRSGRPLSRSLSSRSPPPAWQARSRSPPGRQVRPRSRSRPRVSRSPARYPPSRSPARKRGRSRSLARSRYSRSPSPRRPRLQPAAQQDGRGADDIAAAIAVAAQHAKLMAQAVTGMPSAAQQAVTRHARRIYVGGLPGGMTEAALTQFFSSMMMAAGASTAPGPPVVSVYMNHDKRFAFIELRSVEDASNAMAFDSLTFQGEELKIRRPHDYNLVHARTLGPTDPDPALDLRLIKIANTLADTGGVQLALSSLPPGFTSEQARELLQPFGAMRSVVAREDGSCFAEFADPGATDVARAQLDGSQLGGRVLVARRLAPDVDKAAALQQLIDQQQAKLVARQAALLGLKLPAAPVGSGQQPLQQPAQPAAAAVAPVASGEVPRNSRVVCLRHMVERDELLDDEDFAELLAETRSEVVKYGQLAKVAIPRPAGEDPASDPVGVGLVFLEYEDWRSAERAHKALHGRKFGDNSLLAEFVDELEFVRMGL